MVMTKRIYLAGMRFRIAASMVLSRRASRTIRRQAAVGGARLTSRQQGEALDGREDTEFRNDSADRAGQFLGHACQCACAVSPLARARNRLTSDASGACASDNSSNACLAATRASVVVDRLESSIALSEAVSNRRSDFGATRASIGSMSSSSISASWLRSKPAKARARFSRVPSVPCNIAPPTGALIARTRSVVCNASSKRCS